MQHHSLAVEVRYAWWHSIAIRHWHSYEVKQ